MSLPEYERNADGEPQLRVSLVLFADLLGTSQHAQGANAGATLVAMDAALRRARLESDVDNTYGHGAVAWFSDNVAIGVPLAAQEAEASIGFALVSAMWLQFELARRGFFLRGGIVVGDHFADDDFMFGPALVDAVQLEENTSQPRIALDERTVEVVDLCSSFQDVADSPFHLSLATEGGTTFISYLDGVLGEADDEGEAKEMLTLHRDAIDKEMQAGHPASVHSKYVWLAEYHNFVAHMWFPTVPALQLQVAPQYQFARYVPAAGVPIDGPKIHAALAALL